MSLRARMLRRMLALALATAALLAAATLLYQRRSEEEQRRDQILLAYQGSLHRTLDRLYLDVEVLATLFGDGAGATSPGVTAYLAEKREELAPLDSLTRLPPDPDTAAVDLLTSAASAGLDSGQLAELPPAPLLAAHDRPTGGTDLLVAIREPALGRRPGRRGELVALVDGTKLLDSAFAGLPPLGGTIQLWSGGRLLGTWPADGGPAKAEAETREAVIHLGDSLVTITIRLPPVPLLSPRAVSPAVAMALGGLVLLLLTLAANRPAAPTLAVAEGGDAPASGGQTEGGRRAAMERLWLLGDLAGSLAHDLSQPLNVVRLAAEGAIDRLRRGDDDRDRLTRSLTSIADQSVRLQEMVDRLRAAARRPARPPEAVSPVEAVRCALAGLLPRLEADGIRLAWHADPAAPPVWGHPARLERAVANLLDNACDAIATAALTRTAADGHLGTLSVACRGDGAARVVITVEDDGAGFPPEVLERFDSPAGGHGIGLTVALGVVAEMGGRIRAANLAGGARVEIDLPAAAVQPGRPAGTRRHVLVVDDTAEAVDEIAAFLATRGWRVTTATSGNQAWRAFAADPAEAVVTDLHMADGDGFALIRRLRDSAPETAIIAVTTAHGDDAARAVAAGAVMVLPKPAALADIAGELDEATARFD